MSAQQQATTVMTIRTTAAVTQKRGVISTGAMATTGGNGDVIIGIADHDALINTALRVIRASTAIAEAGAAIDGTEPRLKTDSVGRFVPWTTGGVVAARLVSGQIAIAAGDMVEVIPVFS